LTVIGGANSHGSVLKPATLASMFEPQYQPDPRVPGIGLAFSRFSLGGHLAVEHEGILPGFNSDIFLAPGDGVGVMAFTNGARQAMLWLPAEAGQLLGQLIGVPDDVIRTDVPQHAEVWADIRAFSPIPAVYRGFVLHPDDKDPYVFRVDLSQFGIGTARVLFTRDPGARTTAVHLELYPISLQKQPAIKNPRYWLNGALGAAGTAAAATAVRRRSRPSGVQA
jgi:hypothetical protein